MVSYKVCDRCRKKVRSWMAKLGPDMNKWNCPAKPGTDHFASVLIPDLTVVYAEDEPPDHCPRKFEHCVAAGMTDSRQGELNET
jgi:hypothetical protein